MAALFSLAAVAAGCGGGAAPPAAAATPARLERATCELSVERLVRSLRGPMTVTAYVERDRPQLDAVGRRLDATFQHLARALPEKLVYRAIDPRTVEQKTEAKEAGLVEVPLGDDGSDRAFAGVTFAYGREKDAVSALPRGALRGLEFWMFEKIRDLRDRVDDRRTTFGVVTGKDEIKLSEPNLVASAPGRGAGPNLQGILEQALPYYRWEEIDLRGGDAKIDPALVGLIVTQPAKDFTEKELRRIDEFLMRGDKSLAVFAGAVNMKASDASMRGELDLHGLDRLLEGYGVEMKKEAVFDWSRPLALKIPTQGQVLQIGHFGVLSARHDPDVADGKQLLDDVFPGLFRLDELAVPFPSSLVPHAEKQPSCSMKAILRTTERATVLTTDTVDEKAPMSGGATPRGEYAQRVVGVVIDDKEDGDRSKCLLRSAYGGHAGQGVSAPPVSAAPSRLVVIASPQFLANPFARAGNPPPTPPQMKRMGAIGGDEDLQLVSQFYAEQHLTSTILAFKMILDWMAHEDGFGACAATIGRDRR